MREIKFQAYDKANKVMLTWKQLQEMEFDFDDPNLEFRQYTGLKDKNGKEAYQDAVWQIFGAKYLIQWTPSNASFELVCIEDGKMRGAVKSANRIKEGEIIDNIYENPELVR